VSWHNYNETRRAHLSVARRNNNNQEEQDLRILRLYPPGQQYLQVLRTWLTTTFLFEDTMLEGLFQPMHLIVVLFIALLIFGPKKLPELGKGLGDGIRSFKNSMREKEESATTSEAQKEVVNG